MSGKKEIPDLSNATPDFLLDEIANLRDIQKGAKFLEGIYRTALDSRRDLSTNTVESEKFRGTYVASTQERIDTEAIRSDTSRDDLIANGWIKTISTTTLKIEKK